MHVGFCTPLRRLVFSDYMVSLIHKLNEVSALGHRVSVHFNDKIPISWARQELVDECLAARCDKLVFIDSDIAVPRGVIPKLLESDADIASALYYSTSYPHKPVVRIRDPNGGYLYPDFGENDTEVVIDGGVGFGCCVVDARLLSRLPRPTFQDTWFLPEKLQEGEDIFFCRMVREAGGIIKVYPKLVVLHLGGGYPPDLHGYQY